MQIETTVDLQTIVDRLGAIKGAIADLKAEEDALKDILIDADLPAIEGRLYRVAVSQNAGRTVTDWRSIVEKLGASRQLIAANTTSGDPYYTVRVSARTGAL